MRLAVVSDAHFGSESGRFDSRSRVAIFGDFLRYLQAQHVDELILLGDIFDFWFEYRHVIPKEHFEVLELLHMASKNLKLTFIGGNHDLWADGFLEELGLNVQKDPFIFEVDGRKILMSHGDKFRLTDLGSKIVRFLLGNPLAISLFRWVHPDLGIGLAHWVSSSSRRKSSKKKVHDPIPDKVVELLTNGYDLVVSGHLHLPLAERVGDGIFAITGDWLNHFTYLEIEDGSRVKLIWYLDGKSKVVEF